MYYNKQLVREKNETQQVDINRRHVNIKSKYI